MRRLGYVTTGGFNRCHGLAIRPDQREVWSTCAASLAIHRVEPPAFPEVALIALPGKGYWVTFSPDGRYGFVALSDQHRIAVVDAATRNVVHQLAAGRSPKRNLVLDVHSR